MISGCRHLQTTAKHIYVAGDVLGHDMLTYLAAYHGRVVVHNILHDKAKEKMTLDSIPPLPATYP